MVVQEVSLQELDEPDDSGRLKIERYVQFYNQSIESTLHLMLEKQENQPNQSPAAPVEKPEGQVQPHQINFTKITRLSSSLHIKNEKRIE